VRFRCVQRGHRWDPMTELSRSPLQSCRRWFCDAERVAPWVWVEYPELGRSLQSQLNSLARRRLL